jgi:Phosphotransferase enzyme family
MKPPLPKHGIEAQARGLVATSDTVTPPPTIPAAHLLRWIEIIGPRPVVEISIPALHMGVPGTRTTACEPKPSRTRRLNGRWAYVSWLLTPLRSRGSEENSMTTPAVMVNDLEFRLALVWPDRRQLLTVARDNAVRLPRVTIPPCTRLAEQLTRTVKERWGFDSVVLEVLPDGLTSAPCAVIEIRSPEIRIAPESFFAVHVDAIGHDDFTTGERAMLKALLAGTNPTKEPFCRLGWLDDVVSWIESKVYENGIKLTGKFRQLNSGRSFSLIRFETNCTALWFKAVGEPNLRELPVSVALARYFSSYVPHLLATNAEWNAWLTVEAEGSALGQTSQFGMWVRAAKTLANLQVESCAKSDELLQAGCRDLTVPALLEQVDAFLQVIEELMTQQRKVPPPVLDKRELQALGVTIKNACRHLAEVGFSDALGHLDFNPGNILLSPTRCVFLDWAEAYVGHPFLTFEYFLEHFRRLYPGGMALDSQLTSAYIDSWRSIVGTHGLGEAMLLAPLIAVFAYAVTSGAWKDEIGLQHPNIAGHLRGMTRRMHREAALLEQRGKCA